MYISDYLNDFVSTFNSFHEDGALYDAVETKDCYEYEFNLAGFKKENVKVNISNKILKVEAKQGKKDFYRAYRIPQYTENKTAVAKYEDGLLKIKINKKESQKSFELEVE